MRSASIAPAMRSTVRLCGGTPACVAWLILSGATTSHAAKIGDLVRNQRAGNRRSIFSRFASRRCAMPCWGRCCLGISCGLLGSFIVVRKMALVGDALSHAVLPGVALGFLWNMSKDPVAIFVGATIAGLSRNRCRTLHQANDALERGHGPGPGARQFFRRRDLSAHNDPAAADGQQNGHR